MPKMIFVNLPVEKSVAFYEAIGFTKDARFSRPGSAAAMVWSDAIVFHDPEPGSLRRLHREADR
jgi:predicted lactoylglutathione lyase